MSRQIFLTALVVVLGVHIATAQNGSTCHMDVFQMTARHNINIPKFMGDWYFHEYATSNIGNTPQPTYKCLRASFFQPNSSDISHLRVVDSWVDLASGQFQQDIGSIELNNTRSPFTSMWTVYYPDEDIEARTIIFQSDLEHEDWALIYGCSYRGPEMYRQETLQAITRSRVITNDRRQFLKALMVGYGFRIGDHREVSQEDC